MKDTVQLISHTMIWLLLLLHDLAIVLTIERGCRTLACAILQRVKMSNHYRCGFTILRFLFLLPKRKSFHKIDWLKIWALTQTETIIDSVRIFRKPIWTYSNLSKSVCTYWNLSKLVWTFWKLSEAIQTCPYQFEHTKTYLNLSKPIQTY